MRLELAHPGIQYPPLWAGTADLSSAPRLWNVMVTAHGLIMTFFVIMPAMIGGFGPGAGTGWTLYAPPYTSSRRCRGSAGEAPRT